MKNTIITGAAALALATPAFAGEEMTMKHAAPSMELGLSGNISLAYQDMFEFRGVSGILKEAAGFDTDVLIAEINAKYAFTESLALVTGFRVDSARQDRAGDQEEVYVGGLFETGSYAFELGWRHFDSLGSLGSSSSEIYASAATVCPWTGADLKLLWAHDIDQFEGDYLKFSAVKGWELNDWASIELGAGISYSFDYWQTGNSWNSWDIGLAAPLKATEYLTVTPYVTYSEGMSALDGFLNRTEDEEVIWGVKASVDF